MRPQRHAFLPADFFHCSKFGLRRAAWSKQKVSKSRICLRPEPPSLFCLSSLCRSWGRKPSNLSTSADPPCGMLSRDDSGKNQDHHILLWKKRRSSIFPTLSTHKTLVDAPARGADNRQ